ncbi:MAG: hypothetical protein ABW026_11655, partial [Microvirga sp.]
AWTSSLLLWASLCAGAVCGALAFAWAGLGGLWVPAIVVLALAWALPSRRKPPAGGDAPPG